MLRNILLGLGIFAALISILIFSGKLPIGNDDEQAKGEVMLWGTIPENQMNQLIQQFNPQARQFTVAYREVPEAEFNNTLLEALASGTGPDLIIAPHQIILSNAARLYPFPPASMSEKQFRDTYVDGSTVFMTAQGAIALPVTMDPMVLFYNRSLLAKAGFVGPPVRWDDVVTMTPPLTIPDGRGGFTQSAIAIGAPNTTHAKDVLMATVGQLGQVPILTLYSEQGPYRTVTANQPASEGSEVIPLATAVRFFSEFSNPSKSTYTWSQYQGNDADQFVAEKLAMYIGYASEYDTLRARNLKADFDMATLPQTKGYNTFVTAGNSYGIATVKNTTNLLTSLTVQSLFAGSGVAPAIANVLHVPSALRTYTGAETMGDVVAKSRLVARPWFDSFPAQSTTYVRAMLSDVINGRMGPVDAAATFVSRLQDLYTPI